MNLNYVLVAIAVVFASLVGVLSFFALSGSVPMPRLPGMGASGLSLSGGAPADYNWNASDPFSGEQIAMEKYRGEVLVIKVWATWCPPCVEEMPAMQRMYDTLGPEGVKVMAISVDDSNVPVKQYIERTGLTMPIALPTNGLPEAYETDAIPTSFIISRDGRIVSRTVGMRDWDSAALHADLRALLAQPKS